LKKMDFDYWKRRDRTSPGALAGPRRGEIYWYKYILERDQPALFWDVWSMYFLR